MCAARHCLDKLNSSCSVSCLDKLNSSWCTPSSTLRARCRRACHLGPCERPYSHGPFTTCASWNFRYGDASLCDARLHTFKWLLLLPHLKKQRNHCFWRIRSVKHLVKGWRRLTRCLELQVIFCKRAANYRALLRKMTCEDKPSYASVLPCTASTIWLHFAFPLYPVIPYKCRRPISFSHTVELARVHS